MGIEKKFEVDKNTRISWLGRYRDVNYEIAQHSFVGESEMRRLLPASMWNTYVYLSEELHEKFKSRINDAPWNGGQTYYRKHTEEHLDISPDLKTKWDSHYYKIGDDFQHLWDNERQDLFSKKFMEKHIQRVIDYMLDGETI